MDSDCSDLVTEIRLPEKNVVLICQDEFDLDPGQMQSVLGV